MAAAKEQIVDMLASLAIFADLARPELEHIAHELEEQYFPQQQRVLRQGISGSAFYIVLEGEAAVVIDGQHVSTLGRGEVFGEVSLLLGEPPTADIVALRPLRCLVLAGDRLADFLIEHPRVAYRILQSEARKLANATRRRLT
jgi:CRP-like cAMP-binding protein